jgi:protein-S-isoprenylcysteine O-methyltransferase Ste14
VDADQRVISTGPYALLRHPMYVGGMVMMVGTPPTLGSGRGLFAIVPITTAIVWRLLEEGRFLVKNLPGYAGYRETVRYRLVPFLW